MDNAIPSWGFRAHGLIEYSSMQLDGSHISFRQPTGRARWQAGRTSLIDFGAKDKAILSSDQVHGEEIGPDSWLYKAPDSSVWVVSAESSGDTVNVQLDRFGEFAVLPESYSYSVQRPSRGGNRYVRYDVAPNGSAAVFCVMSGPNVVSWDEITLSGMPESCEIVANILFDDKQTQGTVTESDTLETTHYHIREVKPGEYIVTTFPEGEPPAEDGYYGGREINGSITNKVEGAILSVYYTAAGDKKEVRGSMVVDTTMSGTVSITFDPVTRLQEQNTNVSVAITIGGSTYEAWAKEEETKINIGFTNEPVITNNIEYSSGYLANNVDGPAAVVREGLSAGIYQWRDADGHASTLYLSAATLANAVLAVQAMESKGLGSASASYGPVFARGVDKGAIITKSVSADLPWVSHNPITGAVAFSHETPVSWT